MSGSPARSSMAQRGHARRSDGGGGGAARSGHRQRRPARRAHRRRAVGRVGRGPSWVERLGAPPGLHIGEAHGQGSVTGTLSRPDLGLRIKVAQVTFAGRLVDSVTANVRLSGGTLSVSELKGQGLGGQLTGEAELGLFAANGDLSRPLKEPTLRVRLSGTGVSVAAATGWKTVAGAAQITLAADGKLSDPEGHMEVKLPTLSLAGDPYEGGGCTSSSATAGPPFATVRSAGAAAARSPAVGGSVGTGPLGSSCSRRASPGGHPRDRRAAGVARRQALGRREHRGRRQGADGGRHHLAHRGQGARDLPRRRHAQAHPGGRRHRHPRQPVRQRVDRRLPDAVPQVHRRRDGPLQRPRARPLVARDEEICRGARPHHRRGAGHLRRRVGADLRRHHARQAEPGALGRGADGRVRTSWSRTRTRSSSPPI